MRGAGEIELFVLGVEMQDLKPEQAVALVACLVWREKSDAAARVSEELEGPVAALREAARRVAKVGPSPFSGCQALFSI